MADNVAGSAAFFKGVEIVNDARTIAYLENGLKPGSMVVNADCGCPGLVDIIGCDFAYTDPATDDAPWYSPDHPESAEFAGFFVTEFEGLGSTFTREVLESQTNGGILGRGRFGSRELTWKGFLLGANCCAVSYGLRWLSQILSSPGDCQDCSGDDLDLLVCCPSAGSTAVEPFRQLKGVALLEGPEIISERRISGDCGGLGGCGGSAIIEVEFTLVASQPWLYRSEIPVVNCIPFDEGQPRVTTAGTACPPVDCAESFLEAAVGARGCTVPILPPSTQFNLDYYTQPTDFETATYITVPRFLWREFGEVVPYIVISTGAQFLTDLNIAFYASASGDPCGDLSLNAPACEVVCDKLQVLALPGGSVFILDGRTQTMSVLCSNGGSFPGEPVTSGPFGWPSFSCFGFCIEVTYSLTDLSTLALPFGGNGCISVSLFPREV